MVDWDRVAELQSEVGDEDFKEVVELFLGEVGDVLERLARGANHLTLESDMHFLKGAALNLGFAEFSRACQEGELRAAAEDFGSIDIAAIADLFEQSQRSLASGLGQNLGG